MDGGECDVHKDLLNGLPHQYKKSGISLLNKLKIISERGLTLFSSEIIHEVSKSEKIYEIVQGNLRLIFFHGNNEIIAICTEIVIKKTQKTKPAVVNKAAKIRKAYFEAASNKSLIIIEEN